MRDHPREYGENSTACLNLIGSGGSSPRIRGEFFSSSQSVVFVGIIPANTGRILGKDAPTETGRDHPREYGENVSALGGPWNLARIIPANTGRISCRQKLGSQSRDHPREYGENEMPLSFDTGNEGSSPRIRGESCAQCLQ